MGEQTSTETANGHQEAKRQQFTSKQRMDMYAFCVLELEMHSNKVSIKKQQQAIQRVLNEQHQKDNIKNSVINASSTATLQLQPDSINQNKSSQPSCSEGPDVMAPTLDVNRGHIETSSNATQADHTHQSYKQPERITDLSVTHGIQDSPDESKPAGSKTLFQLQQEVAMTRKCYSDYQRTQVLTSSMLRDVQMRFSKYYPTSVVPSRSTIKHVFEKCVSHGTVENIKTPRKATKIPRGDEIEHLLIHEPQLSLRQMAQKLNVSTGTVSRRCKTLGIVPDSVTLKHQQMALARRQKQMKLHT